MRGEAMADRGEYRQAAGAVVAAKSEFL